MALTVGWVAVMGVLSAEVAAVARSVGGGMAAAANVAAVEVEVSAVWEAVVAMALGGRARVAGAKEAAVGEVVVAWALVEMAVTLVVAVWMAVTVVVEDGMVVAVRRAEVRAEVATVWAAVVVRARARETVEAWRVAVTAQAVQVKAGAENEALAVTETVSMAMGSEPSGEAGIASGVAMTVRLGMQGGKATAMAWRVAMAAHWGAQTAAHWGAQTAAHQVA